MQANYKDLASGLFFIIVGALYGTTTLMTLPIGTALNMGPGYFPVVLSALVTLLGLIIFVTGFRHVEAEIVERIPWRPIGFISAAIGFFAFGLERLGLVPTVLGCVLLVACSDASMRPKGAIAASLALSALCYVVFIYFLSIPVPAIGPFLHLWGG